MVLVMVMVSFSIASAGKAEVEWVSVKKILERFPSETVSFNLRLFEDQGKFFASDLHVKVGDTSFCLGDRWIYLERAISKKEEMIEILKMESYEIGVVKVYEYTFNDINEAEKIWIRMSDMDALMG